MVLEAKIPEMSIKAKRPPISPPFNLSKFDLIKSIDKKTIVALREEIFKKVNNVWKIHWMQRSTGNSDLSLWD